MSNNGMTINDVRERIVKELKHNHISDNKMEQLFGIFFDCSEVWAKTPHLIQRVSDARDPIRLEEAARIVINPWMYYEYSDSKYYVWSMR